MKLLKRMALLTTKVLLSLVLLLALLLGVMLWQSRNVEIEYEQFSVLESDGGSYILTIEIGNPVLPYGPHSVAIAVKNTSDSRLIVAKTTRLANDGMGINSENISANWIDSDTASVCVRGDEQRDVYLLINMQNRNVSERYQQC